MKAYKKSFQRSKLPKRSLSIIIDIQENIVPQDADMYVSISPQKGTCTRFELEATQQKKGAKEIWEG